MQIGIVNLLHAAIYELYIIVQHDGVMVWFPPQDPYYTGALHAFLPNLDDSEHYTQQQTRNTDYGNQNTKRPLSEDAKTLKRPTAL